MTIVEALHIVAETMGNLVYRQEFHRLAESIKQGASLTSYLVAKPKLFPFSLSSLVNVGETTGKLSDTLHLVSEFYEEEVENTTKNLATTLEPMLIVLMGAVVGFIALSIITPIYQVSQGIKTQ